MAKQGISTGGLSGIGADTLFEGALKINSNFDEIYSTFGDGTTLNPSLGGGVVGSAGTWSVNASGIHTSKNVGIGTELSTSALTVEGDGRFSGVVTANSFVGNGSSLTGISTFSGDYNDLTNTPTNLSVFSNDVGFITSYTETSTLNDILVRGNTSGIGMSVGVVTATRFESTSAGTPTLDSPNNLNINAVTVAISTDLTVGRDLDVTGDIQLTNLNASGIVTAASFSGPLIGNVTGDLTGNADTATYATTSGISTLSQNLTGNPSVTVTDLTALGNVSIAGTLTYEDVTNVDSIGIITARSDVHVGAGLSVVGVSTISQLNVGAGGTVITTTSTGNVGIGTTNPTSRFVVASSSKPVWRTSLIGNEILVHNTSSSLSDFSALSFSFRQSYPYSSLSVGTQLASFNFVDQSSSLKSSIAFFKDDNYAGIYLSPTGFSGLAFAGNTGIVIRSSGNVGIGTTNPTSALTVAGDVSVSGVSTVAALNADSLNLPNGTSTLNFGTDLAIGHYGQFPTSGYLANFSGHFDYTSEQHIFKDENDTVTYMDLSDTESALYGGNTKKLSVSGTGVTITGDVSVSGVTTSVGGFTSGIGVTDPVQITVSGNVLTFTVPGVGSTSLILF